MLRVEGLTKYFGGVAAVKEVGFNVPEGTIYALIGPNGAGKTTVFNLITGVLPPDRGSVSFRAQPWRTYVLIRWRLWGSPGLFKTCSCSTG